MYTYDDIKTIEDRFKKFLVTFGIITVIFIGLLIAICKNWGTVLDPIRLPVWPLYILGVLYAVYAVFAWSMIGIRMIKYRNFVYSILTGLDHSVEGKITAIDDDVSYDNDLEFYSIRVKENESEESRLLHLDAVKDIERFEVGRNVKLKIFGNYIKDILS